MAPVVGSGSERQLVALGRRPDARPKWPRRDARRRRAQERLAEFDTVIGLEVRQRLLDLDSARAQVPPRSTR